MALGHEIPKECPWPTWLSTCASMGSFAARQDLQNVDPSESKKAEDILRRFKCGVGAEFFREDQFIDGWSHAALSDPHLLDDNIQSSCRTQQTTQIADLKVNRRGDRLIHFASSCGSEIVRDLLRRDPGLLNSCNDFGETPLLCAMRAGHDELAISLLQSGADASKATNNGDGPLHWLVSIADEKIPSILPLFMDRGASIHSTANAPLKYVAESLRSRYAYGEQCCRGTALHWAVCRNRAVLVQGLLHSGLFPWLSPDPTPLSLAAFLQYPDCLEVLMDECKSRNMYPTFSQLHSGMSASGDLYSMLIRHGTLYKTNLRRTIEILTNNGPDFIWGGVDGRGSTCLSKAIIGGAEEVAMMYLEFPRWRAEINCVNGEAQATPYLLAVQHNMERLVQALIHHDADTAAKGRRQSLLGPRVWRALHYFISASNDRTSAIFPLLLEQAAQRRGANSQGSTSARAPEDYSVETPFALAIDRNLFEMAVLILEAGAAEGGINALHTTGCQGALNFSAPTTILGRIIKSNMHNSVSALQFLLHPPTKFHESSPVFEEPSFIVTPSLKLSALHEVARFGDGVVRTQDGEPMPLEDVGELANREILLTLLEKYSRAEELDLRGGEKESTALQMAVESFNDTAVEELLAAGASWTVEDAEGFTAGDLLEGLLMSMEGAARESDVRWTRL